jgi:glycosyltransferase involved in cell wall biosynthesis
MLHRPADAVDLAERVAWAALHPVEMARMGETCREEFEAHYMAGRNLERLIDIYGRARGRRV